MAWRILYLRALIDSELAKNDYQVSPRCEEALARTDEDLLRPKGRFCRVASHKRSHRNISANAVVGAGHAKLKVLTSA